MAAVASPMYHNPFMQQSSSSNPILNNLTHAQQQQQPEAHPPDGDPPEDELPILFCRALYDYEAQDASALSFRRDDIIEVWTKQPSGWWDGVLGDERGWFPSNYVVVITEEEAEAAFAAAEQAQAETLRQQQAQMQRELQQRSHESGPEAMVDMSHAMLGASPAENEEWLEREMGSRDGLEALANVSLDVPPQTNDFWMPQVTPTGQIYYLNTQTGQHSREIPQEPEDQVSDGELAGLTSQSSSRSGTSAGLGLGPSALTGPPLSVSDLYDELGVQRRPATPEPWVRKLADDGMSYYYWNKVDNSVQWTRPEPSSPPPRDAAPQTNGAPMETVSNRNQESSRSAARLSVYSDDSDIQPHEGNRTARAQANGHTSNAEPRTEGGVQLTTAERAAQMLQQALMPSPAETLTDLAALARSAIADVVSSVFGQAFPRRLEEDAHMDTLVSNVVLSVRNLLYVSGISTGHIPSSVLPRDAMNHRNHTSAHSALKPAQRKVTATLSKLVLSARAMLYDPLTINPDAPGRIQGDADELEKAISSFVIEVQRFHHQPLDDSGPRPGFKRLHGMFSTTNIGLGLMGAGAAGSWKGFGFVLLDDKQDPPRRALGAEVVAEVSSFFSKFEDKFLSLVLSIRSSDPTAGMQIFPQGQDIVANISGFLAFISNIHIARHVDVDGIRPDSSGMGNDLYERTVEKARILVRTLEAGVQSGYDTSAAMFAALQSIREPESGQMQAERDVLFATLDGHIASLRATFSVIQQTLDSLLSVGHEQADLAQGDYNGSIEWRMSRLSMVDMQFGGALGPIAPTADGEDMVDMDFVFTQKAAKPQLNGTNGIHLSGDVGTSSMIETTPSVSDTLNGTESTAEQTIVPDPDDALQLDADGSPLFDDDGQDARSPPRGGGASAANKLRKLLGDEAPRHYLESVAADTKPWFLRPNYSSSEIQIDPDGSVRGGTVPALVERLTAHEHGDATFIKTFLMTFKSFTTLDELYNLLVQRFWIQPPNKLAPNELDQWGRLKQHVIRARVLNTFKSMVTDDDVLEKEDLPILDRIKEFISSSDEVSSMPAAKQLLILIERTQKGGDAMKMMVSTSLQTAPTPIVPKIGSGRKLKLLDVDPLELARQLTIIECNLYLKIKPMECLVRSRGQKLEHNDNIATVIQMSNRIADWVADSILSKDDSRRRAATVKQFISVADRCRTMHNFSTMVAITSGLNTPPIRRLKRTWEQVNHKFTAQLAACEMTIDSTKNFNNYRATMASVTPPCVPFIGVFLTTLQFIQDGNPDKLSGSLVNFRKRQKAVEVINDIKRWQAMPFNFTQVPSVMQFVEESLAQFNDTVDVREHFWQLSLEREPREREDEKMARLLQESGFL
ncbi:hypothetical protein HGRIS_005852 [Hohenbuehelia grisea]|uniref:Ras GEF n=1 Tax=Hohenbuehelia grisea TaxID=104357 RepID=A0ABR3K0H0_9AGAR